MRREQSRDPGWDDIGPESNAAIAIAFRINANTHNTLKFVGTPAPLKFVFKDLKIDGVSGVSTLKLPPPPTQPAS